MSTVLAQSHTELYLVMYLSVSLATPKASQGGGGDYTLTNCLPSGEVTKIQGPADSVRPV